MGHRLMSLHSLPRSLNRQIHKKTRTSQMAKNTLHQMVAYKLELITFENLAAERLRLMGFDNRLIIDSFANVLNIHIWLFSIQMIDSEVRNMNPIT